MEHACGIFGIFAPGEVVAKLTYLGLYALQHRGQESAGMAVSDGSSILIYKDMGLVSQVFNDSTLSKMTGHIAVGHVRYSTTGSSHWENAQPVHAPFGDGSIALAHNGNLVNIDGLRSELQEGGHVLESTSDSEVIAGLISSSGADSIEEAVEYAVRRISGAYSVIFSTEDKLFAFRDPTGIRPLCIGRHKDHYVVSSETAGLDILGAEFIREVEPGELISIDGKGLHSQRVAPEAGSSSLCVFEFIYFARPDSKMLGTNLYQARRRMGKTLATESPVAADLVIGVPDSGTPAAIGYAEGSSIPFGEGLIKNRYIGRTFIQPTQTIRKLGIRMKLNPLSEVIAGRRVVVVDDSIVRGNTSRAIVQMLKDSGALEVHMRVSSPPVAWPCFYGIDTADRDELIGATHTIEEIRDYLGADSLAYLSIDGLMRATGNDRELFCLACLDGEYPVEIPTEIKKAKLHMDDSDEASSADGVSALTAQGEGTRRRDTAPIMIGRGAREKQPS